MCLMFKDKWYTDSSTGHVHINIEHTVNSYCFCIIVRGRFRVGDVDVNTTQTNR